MGTRPYTIRLDDDLIESIHAESDRAGLSQADWMRRVVGEAARHVPAAPGWVPVSVAMLGQIQRRAEQIAAAAQSQLAREGGARGRRRSPGREVGGFQAS